MAGWHIELNESAPVKWRTVPALLVREEAVPCDDGALEPAHRFFKLNDTLFKEDVSLSSCVVVNELLNPDTDVSFDVCKSFSSRSRSSSLRIDLLVQCQVEASDRFHGLVHVLAKHSLAFGELLDDEVVFKLELGKVRSRLPGGSDCVPDSELDSYELLFGHLLVLCEFFSEGCDLGSHFSDLIDHGFGHEIHLHVASDCVVITTLLDFSSVVEGKQAGGRKGDHSLFVVEHLVLLFQFFFVKSDNFRLLI